VVSDAVLRMLEERRLREDKELAGREYQRSIEIREAFFEGWAMGMDEREPDEAWRSSRARERLLRPLPEGTFCRCGSAKFRAAAMSDDWICDRCLRPALQKPKPPPRPRKRR
jgi:hypothetical protein